MIYYAHPLNISLVPQLKESIFSEQFHKENLQSILLDAPDVDEVTRYLGHLEAEANAVALMAAQAANKPKPAVVPKVKKIVEWDGAADELSEEVADEAADEAADEQYEEIEYEEIEEDEFVAEEEEEEEDDDDEYDEHEESKLSRARKSRSNRNTHGTNNKDNSRKSSKSSKNGTETDVGGRDVCCRK